jgi:hypothetical protein
MKTIMPNITPLSAALSIGRAPFMAATEKSVTVSGTMLQVGEYPPKTPCHISFIGASHTQWGVSPRITMGTNKAPTD